MYDGIKSRFEQIKVIQTKMQHGECVELDSFLIHGYAYYSIEDSETSGIDTKEYHMSIVTDYANSLNLKVGYLIELENNKFPIIKIVKYRYPFGEGYDTFLVVL